MALQLEALGGLRLVSADGQAVQAQRRRLALLALLAAAGERGLTRDQVVSCLWPETTQDNAKHALNQLLYGIRRSVTEGAVQGVDPLRLDPAVVDSDVRRFESALSAGEYTDAVAHYRGPFLCGFHLADAPEFERWAERERARLAAAHADALTRLATEAESRGDAVAAVAWRRTLVELDPLDTRRATALMRALAGAGDSVGAIAHSRTYEALVRQELDAPADPTVIALASEIRAGSERQTAAVAAPPPADSAVAPVIPPGTSLPSRAPEAAEPTARDLTNAPVGRAQSTVVPVMEVDSARAMPGPATTAGGRLGEPEPPYHSANGDRASHSVAHRMVGVWPRRLRRVLVFAVAGLALAMASFSVRQLTREQPGVAVVAATPAPSIAVLPLRNLSADPADGAFADGMTEELIAMLSRVGDLRVIASTSVYALKDRRLDVRQIAESLHVSHLLEGALQKAGGRLRLQLRLVDARDGATRWSEVYDQEMGDIFAMQDDIARAVTLELGVRLARGGRARPSARRYTPSIEAYEWYLRGTDPTLKRTAAGTRQAREYLERAIATDSSFAAAYAAVALRDIGEAGDVGEYRESFARAERAALKAVALDDSLAVAHVALAWARTARRNWAEAEAELERAVALDPNAPRASEALALLYQWTGRPAAQLAAARAGVEIDPVSTQAISRMAFALAMNGRCDQAIDQLRPLKALTPPAGVAGVISGQCYAAKHMWREAVAEFRWAHSTGARIGLAFLAYAQARAGQRDEAERTLSDLLAGRKFSHGAFGIATVYAGLGDYDEAFTWLEKAAEENSVRPWLMGPMFEELRRDARFARVKKRMGL